MDQKIIDKICKMLEGQLFTERQSEQLLNRILICLNGNDKSKQMFSNSIYSARMWQEGWGIGFQAGYQTGFEDGKEHD